MASSPENHDDGIAIIGMALRFPGANNVDEFWGNLANGVDSISHFSDDQLEPSLYESSTVRAGANYVRARGIIDDIDKFDAAFFRFTPKEAAGIDPQHRVFLEVVSAALEHAGCNPARYPGSIGVWAGMDPNTYLWENVLPHRQMIDQSGIFPVILNNDKDYLATRASYKLDLRGPSVSLQTACSTGLVVVHHAFHALLSYQCDVALAGVSSISVPQKRGYVYQEGAIGSRDGRCRPFDAEASGTVFSDGVGVVVLKRLADAMADGDTVYAVIKGSAINNDGARKAGFSAPSVDGQAEAIAMAQALAGITPDTVTYVEAHGTATPLGDPIEIAALTKAFRAGTEKTGYCAIGSVKGNIGHLDSAAGIAGLIKAALALHHKKIPASLYYSAPNPQIDFAASPFFVNTALTEWIQGHVPRRAGVSSFGIGGTNAHAVLEEAPPAKPTRSSRAEQLLVLSAKTAEALDEAAARLTSYLRAHPEIALHDVAYTLQEGRQAHAHRLAVVARTPEAAADALEARVTARAIKGVAPQGEVSVAFMFPGQGSQHVGMAAGLYESEPVFRRAFDSCADAFTPHIGLDIRDLVFPAIRDERSEQRLSETMNTQPVMFAVEYALAQLLMSWGIVPRGMIGHSVGEYTAACLSGVLSLDDLGVIAARARLMQQQPRGAMMAVRMGSAELEPLLGPDISIAGYNAPELMVVSGTTEAIDDLHRRLAERGVGCKALATSHAFHSPMMDGAVAPFRQALEKVRFRPPRLDWISCLTGDWISADKAVSPDYWTQQMRQAVRFSDGVQRLLNTDGMVLLEVGPGTSLTTLVRQHRGRSHSQRALATLGNEHECEVRSVLEAVGRLWTQGLKIDWAALRSHESRRHIPLPTYAFERRRHWMDPVGLPVEEGSAGARPNGNMPVGAAATASSQPERGSGSEEALEARIRALLSDISGIPANEIGGTVAFLDLGLDSLLLSQLASLVERQFGVSLGLPQLMGEFSDVKSLARRLADPEHFQRETAPVIEPFFFGPASQQIFGTFHPAADGASRVLTLVCPPLFSEYMRVHFALRQLAISLSARGHDVLRIDYRGTGDSFGELNEVSLSDWMRDIDLAVQEGLSLSGNKTVRVVGVRAGALMALKALSAHHHVDRFVLWDPIADGGGYLADLRRVQQTMLGRTLVSAPDREQAGEEYAGYVLSDALVEQMEALHPHVYGAVPKEKLHIVETSDVGAASAECTERHHIDYNCDWATESEDMLVPKPVLERLVTCLTAP